MQSIRKQHSDWDRTKREFEGILKTSSTNKNTKGTSVEKDLQELVKHSMEIDKELMELELVCTATGLNFNDQQLKRGAEMVSKLKDQSKEGKKYAKALKSWFKF